MYARMAWGCIQLDKCVFKDQFNKKNDIVQPVAGQPLLCFDWILFDFCKFCLNFPTLKWSVSKSN